MIQKFSRTAVAAAALGAFALPTVADAMQCSNDTWKKVMTRGELVVGV